MAISQEEMTEILRSGDVARFIEEALPLLRQLQTTAEFDRIHSLLEVTHQDIRNTPHWKAELGRFFFNKDQLSDARETLEGLVRSHDGFPLGWFLLARTLGRQKLHLEAVHALRKAAALQNSAVIQTELAAESTFAGRLSEARSYVQEALRIHPSHTPALAWWTVIAKKLSCIDDLETLLNPSYVMVLSRERMSEALRDTGALWRFSLSHESLSLPSRQMPVSMGLKSSDLLAKPTSEGEALGFAISHLTERFLLTTDFSAEHPFSKGPIVVEPIAWATVVDPGGFVGPHYHPKSILTGVYYPILREEQDGKLGRLVFGKPPNEFGFTERVMNLEYSAKPGEGIIFPSYFFHETEPFCGTGKRISVPFDLRQVSA